LCIALSPRLYLHSRSSVTAPSSLFGLSFMQVSSAVSPIFLLFRFLSLTLSYVSALAEKCSSGSDIRLGGLGFVEGVGNWAWATVPRDQLLHVWGEETAIGNSQVRTVNVFECKYIFIYMFRYIYIRIYL